MRSAAKALGWLVASAALALAGWFAINQTDEPLSAEARALLAKRAPPNLGNENGLTALHALPQERPSGPLLASCSRDYFACLSRPDVRAAMAKYRPYLLAYRSLRAKPHFVDVSLPQSPDDPVPAYQDLFHGLRLVLLSVAQRFQAGDRAGALDELAAELAVQRKVAEGGRTLIQKMIGFGTLDHAAVFAAGLARRIPPADTALHRRLVAMVAAPSRAELDVLPALDLERANVVEWMRTREHVRLSDETYRALAALGEGIERPWWDPVAPWFYRPHYSVNLYVAKSGIANSVAKLPATQFLASVDEYWRKAWALEPTGWRRWVLSPVAHTQYYLQLPRTTDYIGRTYGHEALQALVRLQLRLRAAGQTKAESVAAALAGPLGRAFRNPFTGEPFRFDPASGKLGFACAAKYLTVAGRDLRDEKTGLVGLAL